MGPPFRVEWRDEPAARAVWVFGEVDLAVVEQLEEALDCEQSRLEVNLSGVTFMDVSGLTCLMKAAEARDVAIAGSNPKVERLMEFSGTARLFDVE